MINAVDNSNYDYFLNIINNIDIYH